jgi:hypothetical protein
MDLHLDDDQAAALRDVLKDAVRDLSYEISNTDNTQFKSDLRKRREALEVIVQALG